MANSPLENARITRRYTEVVKQQKKLIIISILLVVFIVLGLILYTLSQAGNDCGEPGTDELSSSCNLVL